MPRRSNEAFLPRRFLEGAEPPILEAFRALMRQAAIRLRRDEDRVLVRGEASASLTHLVAKPLQSATGTMRSDARETLAEGQALPMDEAERLAQRMREHYPADTWQAANSLEAFQVSLLANTDTLGVLREFVARHSGVRLFALRTTPVFHFRETFWRLVRASNEHGLALMELRETGRWPSSDALSGTTHIFPAHMVCAPLLTREQPFAAVLETTSGVQVVAIPLGVWNRPPQAVNGWPSGTSYRNLTGEGDNIYQSDVRTYDDRLGQRLFEHCVRGANRLVDQLWSPSSWITDDGELDHVGREIAWGTIDIGFHTAATIGREWSTDEAIWTAFRALGILDGYWSAGGLDMFLTPTQIQALAVATIPEAELRRWAADVVTNYARELDQMFPGLGAADQVRRLRELRNLVHGLRTRVEEAQPIRLEAVRRTGDGNLQLIKDVAGLWWGALLFSPRTHGIVGRVPQSSQAADRPRDN